MDFTNLKSGNGFITVDSIFDRLKHFSPPDGEHYRIQRVDGSNFAIVGVSYYGEIYKLFRVYAGNRDLYLFICDMVAEAVDRMGRPLEVEDWSNDAK